MKKVLTKFVIHSILIPSKRNNVYTNIGGMTMKMTVNNLLNACIGAYNDTLININDFDFTMEWVGKRELIPDSIADMSVVAFKVHENNRIDVVIR